MKDFHAPFSKRLLLVSAVTLSMSLSFAACAREGPGRHEVITEDDWTTVKHGTQVAMKDGWKAEVWVSGLLAPTQSMCPFVLLLQKPGRSFVQSR